MLNRKLLLVAAIFYSLGIATMLLVNGNHKKQEPSIDTDLTTKVINNCIASLEATNELVNNCSAAYSEVESCLVNQNTCNIQQSIQRLKQLNEEKNSINQTLNRLYEELRLLLGNSDSI